MGKSQQPSLTRRCIHLHEAFHQVRARCHRGEPLQPQLKHLVGRSLLAPYCGYSRSSITRLYYRWRRDPRPESLAHRYKPGKRRIPEPLLREFLRRLYVDPARSISSVGDDMRREWRRGTALPGLPSWRKSHDRPPRFPVSFRTWCHYVSALLPISWIEQRQRRKAALRELADLDAMLATFLDPRRLADVKITNRK